MVERPITGPTPHRSGRAELPHPALQLYIHSCRFYLHVPDNKTSTFVPLSSDIQFPAQLNLNMTNWNSVFMRYPALHVRRMFLSQFKYNCQLLRHVQGFPLLRLLWADLTSKGSSLALLLAKRHYHRPNGTPLDLSSSQYISTYMPRLENSADSPQPDQYGCFAWTSMAL